MKIKVEIRCSGFGASYDRTVELKRVDIENLAIEKLSETDASENFMAIGSSIEM